MIEKKIHYDEATDTYRYDDNTEVTPDVNRAIRRMTQVSETHSVQQEPTLRSER